MHSYSLSGHDVEQHVPYIYDTCKSLVSSCLLGDARAWQEFVGIYKPRITRTVAWTLSRSGMRDSLAADTEDVVQEVFVRLVRGNYRLLETWNPDRGTFPTWLTVVARSATLDYLRDKRSGATQRALQVPLDECPEDIQDSVLPSGELHLPKGVLSPRQQSILHLIFEKEMTAEEIAAFLDIHPQTVRSIRHSALQKLRHYYEECESESVSMC
ncbi:sigma-70 family RNA polymerase sigma factor [Desulfovibrio mangrovi]|uniref:RNA polymerase sigma factor n=1 Tax=Desulfovibrio mangrovi TaxID=2976983 RepID=UPI002245C20F|nr:sigma-70 family RNA polymerase sigma factor [Desulfovibrio mangrovi]UZP68785.1 sigma-70 family RNA polymerase sigma factor [Desulfovibrio mangrovi]